MRENNVKKLIEKFEKHQHKESYLKDLSQTQKINVGNRAQRCDCHKLAEVWWEGGMRSNVQISCLSPFWTRMFLREI